MQGGAGPQAGLLAGKSFKGKQTATRQNSKRQMNMPMDANNPAAIMMQMAAMGGGSNSKSLDRQEKRSLMNEIKDEMKVIIT